jgi:hypothetical protein
MPCRQQRSGAAVEQKALKRRRLLDCPKFAPSVEGKLPKTWLPRNTRDIGTINLPDLFEHKLREEGVPAWKKPSEFQEFLNKIRNASSRARPCLPSSESSTLTPQQPKISSNKRPVDPRPLATASLGSMVSSSTSPVLLTSVDHRGGGTLLHPPRSSMEPVESSTTNPQPSGIPSPSLSAEREGGAAAK